MWVFHILTFFYMDLLENWYELFDWSTELSIWSWHHVHFHKKNECFLPAIFKRMPSPAFLLPCSCRRQHFALSPPPPPQYPAPPPPTSLPAYNAPVAPTRRMPSTFTTTPATAASSPTTSPSFSRSRHALGCRSCIKLKNFIARALCPDWILIFLFKIVSFACSLLVGR